MRKLTIATAALTFGALLACTGGDGDEEEVAEEVEEEAPAAAAPLAPTPAAQDLAGTKITAEVCAPDGVEFLADSASSVFRGVAAVGDRVFVADSEGLLRALSVGGGCSLSPVAGFGTDGALKLEQEVKHLSKDASGKIAASNGIFEGFLVDASGAATTCDAKGYLELHSSGTWGIGPWVNSTVQMVEIANGACTGSDWVLQNLSDDAKRKGPFSSVNASTIIGDQILIGGSLAKTVDPDGMRTIGVYNKAGKELRRFGGSKDVASDEGFGWVHDIFACAPGVCVLDSNFRRITAWDDSGAYVGTIDLKELLGLSYPWISDVDVAADGSMWLVAANDREGGDVAEGVIYRISGLGVAGEAAPPAAGQRPGARQPRPGGPRGEGAKGSGERRQRPR